MTFVRHWAKIGDSPFDHGELAVPVCGTQIQIFRQGRREYQSRPQTRKPNHEVADKAPSGRPLIASSQPNEHSAYYCKNQAEGWKPPLKSLLRQVKNDAILIRCRHFEIKMPIRSSGRFRGFGMGEILYPYPYAARARLTRSRVLYSERESWLLGYLNYIAFQVAHFKVVRSLPILLNFAYIDATGT